ncbi:MAG: SLC13 family permease [Prochlorotrichaceae cyanobacterium]|jgi:di/tricarboxylate transporter
MSQRKRIALIVFVSILILGLAFIWLVFPGSPLTELSWQGWLSIAVMILSLMGNAFSSLPAEVVFLGGLAVLLVSGILDEKTALSGFGNSGMITVGVLYVVVTGLQQTGGLSWVSQHVLGLPKGLNRALMRLMFPVVILSAFLNNTPVVAMFIPVVQEWSRKLRLSPSKLMMPLSFAALFGGICTLIGTSTNLVVNGLLIDSTGSPGLGLWDISWVGIPCAMAGTIYLLLCHPWLLPNRKPPISNDDSREYTVEMVVEPGGTIAGKTVEQAGLRNLPGLFLMEIQRGDQVLPAITPKQLLQDEDQLVFVGALESVVDLQRFRGLQPSTDQVFKLTLPRTERSLVEAVVSNTCPLVGQTIREGRFRTRYQAVVIAVARNGERLPGKIGDICLQAGDTLLVEAPPSFVEQRRGSRDFYLVSGIPDSEPLDHAKAPLALGILILMVILASTGILNMLKAASVAAILMLATRCCSPDRAIRNIEWSVLVVIGAALGIGYGLETTGAATAIASTFISSASRNPWVALAVLHLLTAAMTEMITNNAAAALMFPIAVAVSNDLGVSIIPFVISIMVAASSSFMTPIGYQTNLMVYGPGGYRFADFIRVGAPLTFIFFVITIVLAPMVYPFYP